jgi:hypothetical protein
MIDRGDDKAGIGQRLGRVVIVPELAAIAMRDDDERQLVAAELSILHGRRNERVCPLRDLPDWLASRATWVKTGHLGYVQAPERNAQMRKPIF